MKTSHTRPTDAEVIALISSNLQMLNRLLLGKARERSRKSSAAGLPAQRSLLTSEPRATPPPAERFIHAWLSGSMALPVQICSVQQLHAAFTRWCNGECLTEPPLPQTAFTLWVRKWVDSHSMMAPGHEDTLAYKTIKVLPEKRCTRCWIPRGCKPPDGLTWGAWAASSIESFGAVLDGPSASRSGRRSRS